MTEEINRELNRELVWRRPGIHTDPIWMEYALQEVELEANVRNSLLAAQFQTVAAVHTALAEGAKQAAEVLSRAAK
jgi:hypothetical protein